MGSVGQEHCFKPCHPTPLVVNTFLVRAQVAEALLADRSFEPDPDIGLCAPQTQRCAINDDLASTRRRGLQWQLHKQIDQRAQPASCAVTAIAAEQYRTRWRLNDSEAFAGRDVNHPNGKAIRPKLHLMRMATACTCRLLLRTGYAPKWKKNLATTRH